MNSDMKTYSVTELAIIIYRQKHIVIFALLFFMINAVGYLLVADKTYQATSKLFLDKSQSTLSQSLSGANNSVIDDAVIESKIILLQSQRASEMVLKAIENEEYLAALEAKDYPTIERIRLELTSGLTVSRTGDTLVLNIKYDSTDPTYAALIANTYATVFVAEQSDANKSFSKEGGDWIQNKMKATRSELNDVQDKIIKYRIKHNLHKTGDSFIDDSHLLEVNKILGEARANSAKAQAEYDHSKRIVENKDIQAAVATAFDNDVIDNIRIEYLNLTKRFANLKTQLGKDHGIVQNIQQELQEYEAVIFTEMKRIMQNQLSKYEVSVQQEESLEKTVDGILSKTLKAGKNTSELIQLEQERENLDRIYKGYLDKSSALDRKSSFGLTSARIIAYAEPPVHPSSPNTTLILLAGLLFGGGIGLVLALFNESRNDSIKLIEDLAHLLHLNLVSYIPYKSIKAPAANVTQVDDTYFTFENPLHRQSIDESMSLFGETCRKFAGALSHKKQEGNTCLTGVVSCFPHEGKSTSAINLAMHLAGMRKKCLLIDLDFRNPILSATDIPTYTATFDRVIDGVVDIWSSLIVESSTGLYVLPAISDNVAQSISYINPADLKVLVEKLENSFDHIIFDLPPMAATADTLQTQQLFDNYIFVTEWGTTSKKEIKQYLQENKLDESNLVGAIINKVDLTKMKGHYGYQTYGRYVSD